jgi:hypothetical protein
MKIFGHRRAEINGEQSNVYHTKKTSQFLVIYTDHPVLLGQSNHGWT